MKRVLVVLGIVLLVVSMLFTSCTGEQGPQGVQGEKGETGAQGPQGEKGDSGNNGANGEAGKSAFEIAQEQGFTGTVEEWLASLVGKDGSGITDISLVSSENEKDIYRITYADGKTLDFTVTNGAKGEKGDTGATGAQGPQGEKGDTGATGAQGPQGEKGDTGATGAQGPQGEKGDTGATGAQGPQGETGAQGPQGEAGTDGRTPQFRVTDGWLQWKYADEGEDAWRNLYETDGTPAPEGLVSVRFILNGGSLDGNADTIYVTSGSSIVLPTPQKSGYSFLGWYLSTTDEYAVPSQYRVHDSVRLYARWEAGAVITGTRIYTLNDLANIRNNLSGTYVLMNNIDCEGMALPTIGADATKPFSGIFDGQGYTISNYAASSGAYIGLFGYSTGTIMNLNVKDFSLVVDNAASASTVYMGGITGYNAGKIQRCTSMGGTVTFEVENTHCRISLVAGYNEGTIENCCATGTIYCSARTTYSNDEKMYAGGIAGKNDATILNCWVKANIQALNTDSIYKYSRWAGGIAGSNSTSGAVIRNCVAFGLVHGAMYGGDIVGSSASGSVIENCYRDESMTVKSNDYLNTYATAQSVANLSKASFYSISLGWDAAVWDYQNVDFAIGHYPLPRQK